MPRSLSLVPTQPKRVPFAVVALVTSAGGLEALSAVLRSLPADWPTAVVIAQHLSSQGSTLVHILRRRLPLPVDWVEDGGPLQPGHVHVCPSGKRLELLPDGTCALSPAERSRRIKPLDFFLTSVADSYGERALAVVLTGMGADGAAGARAVKDAGGIVLVQSPDSAEQPSMPRVAIENGAADLVLPLHELGAVLTRVVGDGTLPRPRSEMEAAAALFAGGGELGALMVEKDWSATPLGPVSTWPQSLKTAVRIALTSRHSMGVWWGPELIYLYNDAHKATLGNKHPHALGAPAAQVWREVWDQLGPRAVSTVAGTTGTFDEAFFLLMERKGYQEETYYTFSYSPVPNDDGGPGGMLFANTEDTRRIISERQLSLLREVAARTAEARTITEACLLSAQSLETNPHDIPFALLYLLAPDQRRLLLAGVTYLQRGHRAAPDAVLLDDASVWPVAEVLRTTAPCLIPDLPAALGPWPTGAWERPPTQAVALPLAPAGKTGRVGVLIVGLSPHRLFDDGYQGFLDLVARQIAAALANAHAYEEERKRAEALAELDRAKTEFFSNVSHEFRTPLTLMLAPLEELLRRREEVPPALVVEVEVAARNARRLLALVNTLLDFSRLEAGRLRAHFAPTNLATLTTDIASLFRSAAERAGVRLVVDCPLLPEPVWVDREMWEKIVSNLLSNALKFTFAGEIVVTLQALPKHIELIVRDTGVGIPPAELPHLFTRFHRVQGTRARTHEGSGIGLALVHELVRLHHGRVRVQSREEHGSTFTVWLPLGVRPVTEPPPEQSGTPPAASMAATLAEAATLWDVETGALEPPTDDGVQEAGVLGPLTALPLQQRAQGARVLVVDDNADMRAYLCRLLAPHWQVDTATDGITALAQAGLLRPDLIVADVMMPNMDGFELVRRLRDDEALKHTPILLVTARAGEEAAIEGLLAGADDYVVKPFSARELIARIGAQLALARVRQAAEAAHTRLVSALESLTDGFYTVDHDWRFTYVNRRAKEVWRREPEDFLGKSIWEEFPATRHNVFGAYMRQAMAERVSLECEGYYTPLEMWMSMRVYPAPEGIAVYFLDITARKRAEEALRTSEERQAFLLTLSDALRPLTDPVEVQQAAMQLLAEQFEVMRATYFEVAADQDHFTLTARYEREAAPIPDRLRLSDFAPAMSAAYRAGRTLVFRDTETETQLGSRPAAYRPIGIRAWAAVPLVKDGQLVAIVGVHSRTPRAWTDADVRLLEDVAERTWAAVERARAEATVREDEAWRYGQRQALEAALSGAPLRVSLGELVRTATQSLGVGTQGAFYLANGEGTALRHIVGMSAAYAAAVDGFKIGPESLACGLATHTGQPVLTTDVTQEPRWQPWLWLAERFGYRACWSFPLYSAGGQFLGSFAVYSPRPRTPTPRELELAALLSHTAALILARHMEAEARTQAEAALREREAQLAAKVADMAHLQQVSNLLLQEENLPALYVRILDAAVALMHADMGSMQQLDSDTNELRLLAWKGFAPASAQFWERVYVDSSSTCGVALTTGARVIVPDVETCTFMAGTADLESYRVSGVRAVQSTPLVTRDGRVLGMISTHWRHVHAPGVHELRLLDVLARQAADLIERTDAYERLRASDEQSRRLVTAMDERAQLAAGQSVAVRTVAEQAATSTGGPLRNGQGARECEPPGPAAGGQTAKKNRRRGSGSTTR